MITQRAAAVSEVLFAVASQREIVRVQHDGFGCVRHPATLLQPTVAQLPILRAEREAFAVEAAYLPEEVGRHGEIIGRKEAGGLRISVVKRIDDIDDHLAGNSVRVTCEAVNGA